MSDLLYERCFVYMVKWFKSYKELLHFLKKKNIKIKTKQVVMRLLFCAMLWKTICIYYARFRLRREIHDQLPSLERFLRDYQLNLMQFVKIQVSQTSAIQCPVLANESSFHTPFLKLIEHNASTPVNQIQDR